MRAADSSLGQPSRPSLTHLNADTSWLLQFDRPKSPNSDRRRCNILIDPWFTGSQVDFAPWISEQYHSIPSSVQSIPELEERLEAEEREFSPITDATCLPEKTNRETYIDAIVISHEFTDHCNDHTLLEADPRTAVYATSAAVGLIKSWKHFKDVYEIPVFAKGNRDCWTKHTMNIFPWLSVTRLTSSRDVGYLHSGVLLTFQLKKTQERSRIEGLLYTPHGIVAGDLDWLAQTNPPISLLALIHGLHEVSATFMLRINLGADNGARLGNILGAKYWVVTHDEIKDGHGIIAKVLRRKEWGAEEAQKIQEQDTLDRSSPKAENLKAGATGFRPELHLLPSGGTLLLV